MPDDLLDGVDGVVHMAGLSNDPTAEYNPGANWEMNTVATKALAEACKRHGIQRLTFGSSCSIYDGLPTGTVYDETTDVRPRGAYATSKKAGEDELLALADDSFQPAILRQGTVYGYSPRMRFDLVVNTFVKDAISKGRLSLHGGGWMWRPLVDVTDVARAHIHCLEAPVEQVGGQIFNLMHDNYQIRELAMLVAGSAQMRTLPRRAFRGARRPSSRATTSAPATRSASEQASSRRSACWSRSRACSSGSRTKARWTSTTRATTTSPG